MKTNIKDKIKHKTKNKMKNKVICNEYMALNGAEGIIKNTMNNKMKHNKKNNI